MALVSAFELPDGSRPLLEYRLSLKARRNTIRFKKSERNTMTYKHWQGNPPDDANRNAWAAQILVVG
jgi:hypothetical protein